MVKNTGNLRKVPISKISINPENPRLIMDQERLDDLIGSIRGRGEILVPLSVYIGEDKKFIIIDGERRYRAALKLGISEIPVIIRSHPDKIEYVTDMFHIHNMREPWELVPTALKLKEIISYLKNKDKKEPTEGGLSKITGLTRSEIRRCKIILSFPIKIQDLILNEEARTSQEKKHIGKDKLLSEDFFIEVDKNIIGPIKGANKKLFKELGGKTGIFDSLAKKRRQGLIKNIVGFRPISKYIKNNPKKSGSYIRKFILEKGCSLESLLEETGLEFDIYKFSRNLKVFSGAIENLPKDLDPKIKKEILKYLRKMKQIINNKLKEL